MAERNWRRARIPVRTHEVTERMLTPARRAADSSWLAQTVWPSRWYGRDYVGHDALLINAAAVMNRRPIDAVPGSDPLLSVLPSRYLAGQIEAKAAHERGECDPGFCSFEDWRLNAA